MKRRLYVLVMALAMIFTIMLVTDVTHAHADDTACTHQWSAEPYPENGLHECVLCGADTECKNAPYTPFEDFYKCDGEWGEITATHHTYITYCLIGGEGCSQTSNTLTIKHTWENGVCKWCKYECKHAEWDYTLEAGHKCTTCGVIVEHKYPDTYVYQPSDERNHTKTKICDCGYVLEVSKGAHGWKNGKCLYCDYVCKHDKGWKEQADVLDGLKTHKHACEYKCGVTVDCVKPTIDADFLANLKPEDVYDRTETQHILKVRCAVSGEATCNCCVTNAWINHTWENGKCTLAVCGYVCKHQMENGECVYCDYVCDHGDGWAEQADVLDGLKTHKHACLKNCGATVACVKPTIDADFLANLKPEDVTVTTNQTQHILKVRCSVSGEATCNCCAANAWINHTWENGKCTLAVCGYECKHEMDPATGACKYCDVVCEHNTDYNLFTNGKCDKCQYVCKHDWSAQVNNEGVHECMICDLTAKCTTSPFSIPPTAEDYAEGEITATTATHHTLTTYCVTAGKKCTNSSNTITVPHVWDEEGIAEGEHCGEHKCLWCDTYIPCKKLPEWPVTEEHFKTGVVTTTDTHHTVKIYCQIGGEACGVTSSTITAPHVWSKTASENKDGVPVHTCMCRAEHGCQPLKDWPITEDHFKNAEFISNDKDGHTYLFYKCTLIKGCDAAGTTQTTYPHEYDRDKADGLCVVCEWACTHEAGWKNGLCVTCGKACEHKWSSLIQNDIHECVICDIQKTCTSGRYIMPWNDKNYQALINGEYGEYEMTQLNATHHQVKTFCTGIGKECPNSSLTYTAGHIWKDGKCKYCGYVCEHEKGWAAVATDHQHACLNGCDVTKACFKPTIDADFLANLKPEDVTVTFDETQHILKVRCSVSGEATCKCCVTNAWINHTWENGKCTLAVCGYECKHNFKNGICTICKYECDHKFLAEANENFVHECEICDYFVDCNTATMNFPLDENFYKNAECTEQTATNHTFVTYCTGIGKTCESSSNTITLPHVWEDGKCKWCDYECEHEWSEEANENCEHKCLYCDETKTIHTFVDGKCACGEIDPDYVAPVKPGDVNGDGAIDLLDVQMVLWSQDTADSSADVNNDGIVDLFDLQFVLQNQTN